MPKNLSRLSFTQKQKIARKNREKLKRLTKQIRKIQASKMTKSQARTMQQNDPRTQNNNAVAWELQNMNVQPTSPTNASSSGFIVAIGMLFVGLIILSLFKKKGG